MKKLSFKALFIPTISLVIICLVVSLALSFTNAFTKDTIKENEAKDKEISMQTVCTDAKSFEEIEKDVSYKALDDSGNVIGYAISTIANGYGGQVKVMTGFSTDGKILNIDVYYNDDETPGLGKNTSNENFTNQFKDKEAKSNLIVNKDYNGEGQQIDAVTSATISSRAVIAAVNEASDIYENIVSGGEK